MANLYIFAIGGSGSRVLRSLTMLLASGIKVDSTIIPIIVDPDSKNGDLTRVVSEMRLYEQIHDSLSFNSSLKSSFFSANITSLNNDGEFLLPLNGTSGINFDAYIGLNTMSQENQAMMKMLFSNSNLSSTMDVGFKGNPNIGSVVLNQFIQSNEYKTFENNFVSGDRVMIISSIFGGTGASGFPLLLKTMRTSNNKALADSYVASVSLLPYFNLKDDPKSSIKADSFITKMKAALYYYEKNVTGNGTLDEQYYLGDQISGSPYENCDGGNDQINDAHIIEMLAALAIIDFEKKQYQANASRRTNFHEFGLNTSPSGKVVFSDFGQTKDSIMKPLSQMALMNSYLNNRDLSHRLSQRWAKEDNARLGRSFFISPFFNDLYSKFKCNVAEKSGFESWIDQMASNDKSFSPFVSDSDIKSDGLAKVAGHDPHYNRFIIFGKKGYDLMDETLDGCYKELPKGLDAPSSFFEIFYNMTEQLCSKHLDIL